MPYYEFECKQCGKTFTVRQTISEHDRHRSVQCPSCAATEARELISVVNPKTSKKS